ncbi:MAG: tail fiber domain-containing protein [Flavobacteriaceae bacterium]
MKTKHYLIMACLFFGITHAQVGIGTVTPNAQLEIVSTNQATPSNTDGILIPKIDEFPVVPPAAAQDGMLVYATGSGTPTKGFYYWDESTTTWVAIATGSSSSEWIDNGTYLSPVDGDIEDVAIGGVPNANSKFTVRSDKQLGGNFYISGTQDSQMIGVSNQVTNNSVQPVSFTIGTSNAVSNSGAGYSYGTTNSVFGNGNGTHYGILNTIDGNGSGVHYGVQNRLFGMGAGNQIGTYNDIQVDTDGILTGTQNSISGSGEGARFGVSNAFLNFSNGPQYGISNFINTTETSGAPHYGSYLILQGTGDGERFGSYALFQGTGDGNRYGNQVEISIPGNGTHYGNYQLLSGAGSGDKYGSYNFIPPVAGGTGYGVYANVTKTGSYAGYFLGNLAIGTTPANTYILPASRGANGQMMQTDGSGNVSWVTPSVTLDTSPAWYDEGTTNNATTTTSNIIRSGNMGIGVSAANSKIDILDSRLQTSINIAMDDTGLPGGSGDSNGINIVMDNDNNGFVSGRSFGVNTRIETQSGEGYGSSNVVLGTLTSSSNLYGVQNAVINNGTGNAYGTYNEVTTNVGIAYGSYNRIFGAGVGVYSEATDPLQDAALFLGNVRIGTTNLNTFRLPTSRGGIYDIITIDGSGNAYWAPPRFTKVWGLNGNIGVNSSTDFIGTLDGQSLRFRTNNIERFEIAGTGKLKFINTGGNIMLGGGNYTGDGGFDNILIGSSTGGTGMTGMSNIAMGNSALTANTSGTFNIAMGYFALNDNTSGDNNISFGNQSLFKNTIGNHNNAIGAFSLSETTTGINNVALGPYSLVQNTTGNNNIAIGFRAGSLMQTTGGFIPNNNIVIGYDINAPNISGSNQLNIGNLIFGNGIDGTTTNGLISSGNIGIATQNPNSKLHITGDLQNDDNLGNFWRRYIDLALDYNFEYNGALKSYINDVDGSYNIFSDRRLKKNIKSEEKSILEKVLKLNPVTYEYISDKTNTLQHGFIAQEVQLLFPELVNEKETEKGSYLSLNYQAFGVMAIKTIQEQQKEIEKLKEEITILKKLEERIKKLEGN